MYLLFIFTNVFICMSDWLSSLTLHPLGEKSRATHVRIHMRRPSLLGRDLMVYAAGKAFALLKMFYILQTYIHQDQGQEHSCVLLYEGFTI